MPEKPQRMGAKASRIGSALSGRPSTSGKAKSWRNSPRYARMRRLFFAQEKNQACQWCNIDLMTIAPRQRIIHHAVDHRGDYQLYWDMDNWRPACESCHNKHTAKKQINN